MKALILKDMYTLWKQMRIFTLLILVFSVIPSAYNNMFAIVYAAMLPYTALAYDERSKWGQLAAMMPYSTRDIVLSKYILGWVAIGAAAVFTLVAQTVLGVFLKASGISTAAVLLSFCTAAAILSITLPAMFRFGVERGRLLMILIVALTCGSVGMLSSVMENPRMGDAAESLLIVVLPIVTVVLTAISVPLSIKVYCSRQ